jgi:hypothetical protein
MTARGVEPIRRRRIKNPDDRSVAPRIPLGSRDAVNCGLDNQGYPTQQEARQAAITTARQLGAGYIVKFEGKHRQGELPHYHILTPNGQRCRGHFYYGRRPYYHPRRTPPFESWDARKAKRTFQRESEFGSWLFEAPMITVSITNQKNYENENLNEYSLNVCRKVTSTHCPGRKGQFTPIDYFPSMFLVNRGTCPLFIASLVDGVPTNIDHLVLQPGASATFFPHQGSNGVCFACHIGCNGNGRLEHPYSCV